MQRSLIILMIITILVVIFALQNIMVVHLKIWFWSVDIHTGLVLIITFAVGTLLGIFSSVPRLMKKKKEIKDLREKLSTRPDPDENARLDREEPADLADPSDRNQLADPEFEDVITD